MPNFKPNSGQDAGRPQHVRLTLTSGVPVTTADVTSATSIFVSPYQGNVVTTYDLGLAWVPHSFSQVAIALGTLSADVNYDVFGWYTNGVVGAFLGPSWASATARGTGASTTELTLQDGLYVNAVAISSTVAKAGLYLGTVRTTTTTTTEDSLAKRFLWNMYHRKLRPMRVLESTDSWNYTTATWRQANASTANQLAFVLGLEEEVVTAQCYAPSTNASAGRYTTIGLDVTNAKTVETLSWSVTSGVFNSSWANYKGFPGLGYHFLAWLEYSNTGGTSTWYGDAGEPTRTQGGIHGEVTC